jgi:hypothetical protein
MDGLHISVVMETCRWYISDAIKNHTHHLAIIAIYIDGLQCDPGSSEHNGGGENRQFANGRWITGYRFAVFKDSCDLIDITNHDLLWKC